MASKPKEFPPQKQELSGSEEQMEPEPQYLAPKYCGSGKLRDKVAIISGGDSGIGRSVAILFAREGAKVVICYKSSHQDAEKTKSFCEKEGAECLLIPGDLSVKATCFTAVQKTIDKFNKLDILVNHAGLQFFEENFEKITEEHLDKTFKTNVYSMFFLTQAALPHMKEGGSIIITTSVNSFKGNQRLIDYSASKGANQVLMWSLAKNLGPRGIRVNAVAPGPIWTPLIPASFPGEAVKDFGKETLLGRAGQPEEVSPAYVFLASNDSSYMTGQTIHVNGGMHFA